MKISTTALKLKAVPAYGDVMKHLDISRDTPLLYSSGLTYGVTEDSEIPIELFTTYYLTDHFEYTLTQSRNQN